MHYADRVQETTTTTGTGTITLGGAVSGFRAFSAAFSNSDVVRYAIVLGTEWEVGEGVYSSNTLTRVTVFASSNSNSLVNFSAGSKAVWCDIPAATLASVGAAADKSVLYRDANSNISGSSFVSIDETAKLLNSNGYVTIAAQVATSGSIPLFRATAAAHTGQTASTELTDVLFDLSSSLQFATGALTTQRSVFIKARTYTAVGASVITTAATLAIEKAPVAGTNCTITNAYSLWVQAGRARVDGGLEAACYTNTGITINSSATGTVNDLSVAATTGIIRFTNATPPTLTGFSVANGNVAGREICFVCTTGSLTLKSETGSSSANQFKLTGGTDITVLQYEYITFIYDSGQAKWLRST